MSDPWSNTEVDLIIADHFSMLMEELLGRPYSKAFHRNQLRPHLMNRTEGSIEFKHQNISAVLIKLGLPFIKGYKPKSNYQQILEEKVVDFLFNQRDSLEQQFEIFSDRSVNAANINSLILTEDTPPERFVLNEPIINYRRKPFKVNYLEREQMNAALGEKGEELVLEYERNSLFEKGFYSLAEKVERISLFDDSAGFDILSKNENGTDKYIEVKTTKLSKETPIFFSKNEYDKSLEAKQNYNLYRVFDFEVKPRVFQLKGCFDDFCAKEAIQYSGRF